MREHSPEMTNVLLGLHFGVPVCHIHGKPYLVLRATKNLPLGVILDAYDEKRLGNFHVIDWEAEILERITATKPFQNAVTALREDESLDFSAAPSHFDVHLFAQYCEAEFVAQEINSVSVAYEIAASFYDQCFVADVLDVEYLSNELPSLAGEYALEISFTNSVDGLREATSMLGVFMAFNKLKKFELARDAEDALQKHAQLAS